MVGGYSHVRSSVGKCQNHCPEGLLGGSLAGFSVLYSSLKCWLIESGYCVLKFDIMAF